MKWQLLSLPFKTGLIGVLVGGITAVVFSWASLLGRKIMRSPQVDPFPYIPEIITSFSKWIVSIFPSRFGAGLFFRVGEFLIIVLIIGLIGFVIGLILEK